MNAVNKFLLLVLVLITGIANAQQAPVIGPAVQGLTKIKNVGQPVSVGFEEDSLSIKLSNDGTGIIQNAGCYKLCEDFSVVNITHKTKAYANGVEVSIFEARSRAEKSAYVKFNPATREVMGIYW